MLGHCTLAAHSPAVPAHRLAARLQVTISLLQRAMDESGKHKFLIDGFPRNEENRASFEKQVRQGVDGCGWMGARVVAGGCVWVCGCAGWRVGGR